MDRSVACGEIIPEGRQVCPTCERKAEGTVQPVYKKGVDEECMGCFYYGTICDNLRYCSYILVENRRRPCPPGKGCTVKKLERGKGDG